jgi:excisionase family DNA binding protein
MDTVPATLTARQVAALLTCSYRTIYKRIKDNKIPNIQVEGIKRCPTWAIEKILGRKLLPSDLVVENGKERETGRVPE